MLSSFGMSVHRGKQYAHDVEISEWINVRAEAKKEKISK